LEPPAGESSESSTFEDLKAGAQKVTTVAENPGAGQNLGNDQFLGNEVSVPIFGTPAHWYQIWDTQDTFDNPYNDPYNQHL